MTTTTTPPSASSSTPASRRFLVAPLLVVRPSSSSSPRPPLPLPPSSTVWQAVEQGVVCTYVLTCAFGLATASRCHEVVVLWTYVLVSVFFYLALRATEARFHEDVRNASHAVTLSCLLLVLSLHAAMGTWGVLELFKFSDEAAASLSNESLLLVDEGDVVVVDACAHESLRKSYLHVAAMISAAIQTSSSFVLAVLLFLHSLRPCSS